MSGKKLAEEGGRRTDDRTEGDHAFVAHGGPGANYRRDGQDLTGFELRCWVFWISLPSTLGVV